MNPKLRAFLEANGLRKDASETEAWKRYDELVADGIEMPGIDPGTRSAVGPTGVNGNSSQTGSEPVRSEQIGMTADDIAKATRQAVAADISRRNEIEDRLRISGLLEEDNGTFARNMLQDPECTVERAASMIFERLKKRNQPIGNGAYGSMEVGTEASEKFRSAATDGLCLRSGIRVATPAAGANEFRSRTIIDIMREDLERHGEHTRGLGKRQLIARSASLSTSDFPQLMSNLAGRVLLAAYEEWPSTFTPFVGRTDATDFKDIYAVKMSESPDLQGLSENGEYRNAAFSDSKETYRVITKGLMISLTRTMIINDDLRAFTRIPRLFGASAKRMEGDAVYDLIISNPQMSDGVALFHADHLNLGAGALGSAGLKAGRAAMRKQKGMKGSDLDVIAAFLLTTVDDEMDAEVLLRSAALPDDNKSSGVHNPWAGKLTPIADPRLTGAPWYLLAHPNQYPAIEIAYLEGEEQPYVDEMVDFNSDALKIKVRHDFGAGLVDHVGIYKSTGQ